MIYYEQLDNIPVHGGITFCGNWLAFINHEIFDGSRIFIGWDYAHHEDIDINAIFQSIGLITLVPEDKIEQDILDTIDAILKIDTSFVPCVMQVTAMQD